MTDKEVEVANIMANINHIKKPDGTEGPEKEDGAEMATIEMCELVKEDTEQIETQLIQTTSANGTPQLIQVVTTAGQLIATPVSQIQQHGHQLVQIAPMGRNNARRNGEIQIQTQQSIVEDDEDDQQYYSADSGQMLPIKTEMDEDDGTVELIPSHPSMGDKDMEEVVIQSGDDDGATHFIVNADHGQHPQILQQPDQGITYVDVTNHQPSSLVIEPKKQRMIQSQPINNGQQKQQMIVPANNLASNLTSGQQIIQIPGQNGQPGQMIIVPQGNIIVLPQNNEQNNGNGFRTLQLVSPNQVIQSPPQQQQGNQNQQQQILILAPEQNNQIIQQVEQVTTSGSGSPAPSEPPSKKSKNFKGTALEDAVMIAGITEQSGQQRTNSTGQASVVSDRHHYPSPFSQVPVEERPHSCTFCYKRFARADECKRHERIHTDTRPFSCQFCPRRFTRKDHLRTHTRCHTKEKPYICPLCNRGFARSDERIRHVKTHVKKGEGTLEEIKAKMPKPRFEPKQKVRAIGFNSASGSTSTTQATTSGGQQLQLIQQPSPVPGDSGNITARIIQIPISLASNPAQQIHITTPIQHE